MLFAIPSILGHPFSSGDNLIQFNPLRVLAGQIERGGNLPLWNQFNWSGTPLLAGFNAGSFFPTSWLYIILPATWAWGINQALPYFLASFGFYLLMKETGVSEFSSRLTGLAFALSGVMIAQGVHLDMITGISLAPWLLLFASRIIEPGPNSRARNAIFLAVCYALIVLAGAPEAMLDELILLIVFSLAKLARYRSQWPNKLAWLSAAGMLALGISAAQWIPGLEFQRISQRANPTAGFVSFGAFAPQYFYSLFTPYLFGGPGALRASNYFGPFTWEEVTIYPTIGPIIALFSTIVRSIKRTLDRDLLPYLLIAITGTILALGSYTPVESFLYHLPLYGQQRLQGRNILDLDIAMFAFFGVWLDRILHRSPSQQSWIRWIAFLPAAIIAVIYGSFLRYSNFATKLLHAAPHPRQFTTPKEIIIFGIELLIAIASGLIFFLSPRISLKTLKKLVLSATLLDILVFNIFGSLGTTTRLSQFNSSSRQMIYVHSLIGSNSRFAIYDPNLYDYPGINSFGQPDLNISARNHSIQGYSSLSLSNYENATGTHAQGSLSPQLLTSSLVDTLDMKVILTSWRYLLRSYGSPTAVPLPSFYIPGTTANSLRPTKASYPDFRTAPMQSGATDTFGLFGRSMSVSSVDLNLGNSFSPGSILKVGLLEQDGSIVWLEKTTSNPENTVPGTIHYLPATQSTLPTTEALGVVVSQILPKGLYDPQQALVTGVGINSIQGYFALDGQLEPYLTYPHFRPIAQAGSYAVFENSKAKPILRPSVSQVQILNQNTELNGTLNLHVMSSVPGSISRAETYAPGWEVRYSSLSTGQTFEQPITKDGVLQKIPVPAGNWNITVYYHPGSAYIGIWISLASVLVILLFFILRYHRDKSLVLSDHPKQGDSASFSHY